MQMPVLIMGLTVQKHSWLLSVPVNLRRILIVWDIFELESVWLLVLYLCCHNSYRPYFERKFGRTYMFIEINICSAMLPHLLFSLLLSKHG